SVLGGQRPAAPWWEATANRGSRASVASGMEGIGGSWLDPELARGRAIQSRDAITVADIAGAASVFRKRRVYPIGINRSPLEQAIRELGLRVVISRDEHEVDAVLVLKSLYRTQPERIDAAQAAGIPVYVLRGSSIERLHEALADMFRADMEAYRASDANTGEAGSEPGEWKAPGERRE